MKGENVDVRPLIFDHPRRGRYEVIHVDAGPKQVIGTTYDGLPIERRRHQVEVYVSPTGRSVRVYINGTEVDVPRR